MTELPRELERMPQNTMAAKLPARKLHVYLAEPYWQCPANGMASACRHKPVAPVCAFCVFTGTLALGDDAILKLFWPPWTRRLRRRHSKISAAPHRPVIFLILCQFSLFFAIFSHGGDFFENFAHSGPKKRRQKSLRIAEQICHWLRPNFQETLRAKRSRLEQFSARLEPCTKSYCPVKFCVDAQMTATTHGQGPSPCRRGHYGSARYTCTLRAAAIFSTLLANFVA